MTISTRSVPIIMLAALTVMLCGCKADSKVRVISSIPNPQNGQSGLPDLIAQVIEEETNATVANITTVRLITLDGKPFAQGDGAVFSYYHGRPKISVSWTDSTDLLIDCFDCTNEENITLKEVKHNRVAIRYTPRLQGVPQ